MMAEIAALLLACAGCFTLTVLSAIVPWVNAEIVLLSFPDPSRRREQTAGSRFARRPTRSGCRNCGSTGATAAATSNR